MSAAGTAGGVGAAGTGTAGAIVLAAGAGRRLGGVSKGDLRLPDGRRFVDAVVAGALEGGASSVVVVVSPESSLAAPPGARRVVNPDPSRGMLSSVHLGLRALEGETDPGGAPAGAPAAAPAAGAPLGAALLWPVDCPRVGPALVRRLIARWRETGAPLVIPSHDRRRGHPALFDRSLFPALFAAPLARGARTVVRVHAGRIAYVDAGPEVLDDMDTLHDLTSLRSLSRSDPS